MSQVNLLPWREQLRLEKKKAFGVQMLAVLFIAFVCLVIINLYYKSILNSQKSKVNFLQFELNQEQSALSDLKKKSKLQDSINAQLNSIALIRKKNNRIINGINELVRVVPENISLTKISKNKNEVMVEGQSRSNLDITEFVKNISQSPVLRKPDLTEITGKENNDGEVRTFVIKVFENDN